MDFRCDFPCCGAIFGSVQAVSVHKLRCHKKNMLFAGTIQNPQQANQVSTNNSASGHRRNIPRRLGGSGERLYVDRATAKHSEDNIGSETLQKSYSRLCSEIGVADDFLDIDVETRGMNANNAVLDTEIELEEKLVDCLLMLSLKAGVLAVDNMLKLFCENGDTFLRLVKKCRTVVRLREYKESCEKRSMIDRGFQKVVEYEDGISFVSYRRNACDVIREQVSNAPQSGFLSSATCVDTVTHPMNSNIGVFGGRAVKEQIELSQKRDVFWRTISLHGEQSGVGAIQVYSDKSQTTLGAHALFFYPLHVTLLNFTEEWRRANISSGRTIVAYLPVHNEPLNETKNTPTNAIQIPSKITRLLSLRALHSSINNALQPLAEASFCGLSVQTSDGFRLRLHFMMASYVADLPETEDLLSLKRGSATQSPCHRCMVQKHDLADMRCGTPRSLCEAMQLLDGSQNVSEKDEVLAQRSMLPIPPILHTFPHIGLHPCVDIYRVFRCEPMHVFSLGLSPLLKECMCSMLKDENRVTKAMMTTSGGFKSFRAVRKPILREANLFLSSAQSSSPGYGLRTDFSKGDRVDKLDGFFTETGLIGMIEARDHDCIDMVMPFIAGMVDRCCDLTEAPVTSAFVNFVDLHQTLFQYNEHRGWSRKQLLSLSIDIKNFQKAALNAFSTYQPSNMRTCKWHALDHLVDDLRDIGNISALHAGLYESTHRIFKALYRKSSKRSASAMEETVHKQNKARRLATIGTPGESRIATPARCNAANMDGGLLVKTGFSATWLQIEDAKRVVFKNATARMRENRQIKDLISLIGEDGTIVLQDLLRKRISEAVTNGRSILHIPLEFPSSAYISEYTAPKLSNLQFESTVLVSRGAIRFSQRVVAKSNFYNAGKVRMDDIMIEGDEMLGDETLKTHFPVWFAKAKAFVRIPELGNSSLRSGLESSRQELLKPCSNEFCFVQFYDTVPSHEVSVDTVDRTLNCIRVRWDKIAGVQSVLSAAKSFGLVPVDSIRGKVHLVPGDTGVELLSRKSIRKKEIESLKDGNDEWTKEMFYVNRFYQNKDEMYEFIDEPLVDG